MATVYLLSESEPDEQVYVDILDVILGRAVQQALRRLRPGGGISELRRTLPMFFASIRHAGPQDDAFFVVAIDNDRADEHPAHDRKPSSDGESCRHCALMDAAHEAMPGGWPIPGAVAVPVQMLESWLLLMYDPQKYGTEAGLPTCPWRDKPAAKRVYGESPPPQLKDLVKTERAGRSRADFAFECVSKLDPEDLARRSPSFARFYEVVAKWRAADVAPG